MKPSIELLFHYRCETCGNWWSIADLYPQYAGVFCPHCGVQGEEGAEPTLPKLSRVKMTPAQLRAVASLLMQTADSLEASQKER